jgi:OHCU decarboxylase
VSGLSALNAMPAGVANAAFLACCGSRKWADAMTAARPFAAATQLYETADRVWLGLGPDEWRHAFTAHPRIGERRAAREEGGARAASWSKQEQAAAAADATTLRELAEVNRAYEARFGHVFLVCATGRTATELLANAKARMNNDPTTELTVAAEEHRKITRLRLARLLEETE